MLAPPKKLTVLTRIILVFVIPPIYSFKFVSYLIHITFFWIPRWYAKTCKLISLYLPTILFL